MPTVIYVAYGAPYLAMMALSIRSLRRHNPDIKVAVLSVDPKPVLPDDIWRDGDQWIVPETFEHGSVKSGSALLKTKAPQLVNDTHCAIIDADTIIHKPLTHYFQQLDYYDALLRPCPRQERRSNAHLSIGLGKTVGEVPHWNGGVVYFRNNDKVHALFQTWAQMYLDLGYGAEQPSLAAAIAVSDARVGPLSPLGNVYAKEWRQEITRKYGYIQHYKSHIDPALYADLTAMLHAIAKANGKDVPKADIAKLQSRSSKRGALRKLALKMRQLVGQDGA